MSTKAELKKCTADFEHMIGFYLEKSKDPLFAVKTKNITPELEIRFGTNKKQSKPLTKIDYDNVVHQLLLNGWKSDNIEGIQMLRIANEYFDGQQHKQDASNDKKTSSEENINEVLRGGDSDFSNSEDREKVERELRGKRNYMRMSGSIRVEIVGSDLIQHYCQTNSIDYLLRMDGMNHHKMKFTEKIRVKDENGKELKNIDFLDYNFRIAYKAEKDKPIDTDNLTYRNILTNWNNTRKYFRLMNRVRFTHPDYPVSVDMSIVKSNNTFSRKYKHPKTGEMETMKLPNYTYTVQECNLFENPSIYEIELELNNETAKKYELPAYLAALRKSIRFVLSGLQETPYPISYGEQEEVLEDYMERLFGESWKETKKPRPFFIGPSSFTLQLENVVKDDEDSTLNSSLVKITDQYTVTEKADGLRSLLYVSKKGKIYMIDNTMKVKFTGSITKEKTCFDSVLDGEFIMYGKDKTLLFLFAAFDIYYVGGRNKLANVRELDFCSSNPLDEDPNYRLPLLQRFVSVLKPETVVENSACKFQVQVKTFECHYADSQDIFQASNSIWSKHKTAFPYEVDGLIFTPMNTGVGGDKSKHACDLRTTRWDRSFKWKPPHYNTIDFLVEVKKKDGKDLIQHKIYGTGDQQRIVQYKTLILHCGFNAKETSMNPFNDMLHDKIPEKRSRIDYRNDYKPHPFQPTVPYDAEAYLCYVPLVADDMGELQMKATETNDNIYNNAIVEFAYDVSSENVEDIEGPWRWNPIRVRYDKMARLVNGERVYGNSYATANSNWRSIHFPVTESIITGAEMPSSKTSQEVIYYNRRDKESNTRALRDFHNHYVKRKLITGVAKYLNEQMKIADPLLLDYSVGQGGDMSKWRDGQIRFVLGIDLSRHNLVNPQRGACIRYLSHRRDFEHSKMRALFVHGNSGLNIRSKGKAFYDTLSKELVQSVFGDGPNMNRKQSCFEHGIARDGFHISSCMFSLHYFFQNNTLLHNFLRNLSECTRVHGYFIGACFDGEKVFQMLSKKKENESIMLQKDEKKMFEIIKGYPSSIQTFPEGKESVGMPIHVYQETINATFVEYLVNFEYFIQLMENYGFVLVEKAEAEKIGFPRSNGLFDMLYRKMERDNYLELNKHEYANAPLMSYYEQTISFLNRYFIFKKMRDLSETSLKNLEKDIDEEADEAREKMMEDNAEIDLVEEGDIIVEAAENKSDPKSKSKSKSKTEKAPTKRAPKRRITQKRIRIDASNYSPVDEAKDKESDKKESDKKKSDKKKSESETEKPQLDKN